MLFSTGVNLIVCSKRYLNSDKENICILKMKLQRKAENYMTRFSLCDLHLILVLNIGKSRDRKQTWGIRKPHTKFCFWKPDGRPHEKPRHRWNANIKLIIQKCHGILKWVQWWVLLTQSWTFRFPNSRYLFDQLNNQRLFKMLQYVVSY